MKDMKPIVSFDKLIELMVDAYGHASNGRFENPAIVFCPYVGRLRLAISENKHIVNKLIVDEVIWLNTSPSPFCISQDDVKDKKSFDAFMTICQCETYMKTTDKRVPNEVKDIIVKQILTMFEAGEWLEASVRSKVISFFGKDKTIEQYLIEYDLNKDIG